MNKNILIIKKGCNKMHEIDKKIDVQASLLKLKKNF